MKNTRNMLLRRILFLLSFLLLLLLLYLSVQRRPEPAVDQAARPAPLPDVPAERLLPLPLLSAGATAPDSRIEYLFDQNANTLWLLARGKGPGECLEINFLPQRMPFLSGIRVAPARADTLAEVKKMALYVNYELAAVKEGDFDFPIGQKVFALRLCIESTQVDETNSYREGDRLISIQSLSVDRQTGLQSLLFFDREGQAYYPLTPRYVAANVTPSSNLNPVSAFHVGQLFDGRPATAWIEGESASPTGGSIQIRLAEPIQPSALLLWNGYQRSDLHFVNNSRAADLSLTAGTGPALRFDCRDQSGGQVVDLPSNLRLTDFSLAIQRAYPGDQYPETAISELCFLEGLRPVALRTEWPRIVQKELTGQIVQTPLAYCLDRPVFNRVEHQAGKYHDRRQICIQADGGFYARLEHREMPGNKLAQFDVSGHWEVQEARETQTRLRLFGISTALEFTDEATPALKETLFNEVVDVYADRIESAGILGRFYLR